MDYHVPVLLNESIEGLGITKGGVYVDVTFGGGGHSRKIYDQLTEGKLVVFDQDPDAALNAGGFESDAKRSFLFVQANFRYLLKYLKFYGIGKVNGVLADLGVSSHQFDQSTRGFSFRFDGELNMRMDKNTTKTAIEVINEYDEADLIHIFSLYGEIKNARTLAKAIIQERNKTAIKTTQKLKSIAENVGPKKNQSKYLAQLFQSIRIEVNEEMESLKDFLSQLSEAVIPGGKVVIISYHSLEDRLVKNFLQSGDFKGKQEKDIYGNLIRPFEPNPRKPIIPEQEEIERNSRARSAKLRIGIKN